MAAVSIPSSWQARMTRTAISPRLATRTFLKSFCFIVVGAAADAVTAYSRGPWKLREMAERDRIVRGVEPQGRTLRWDGLYNVRDLGGHETPRGPTRFGAVVRSESLALLSEAGRAALTEYGVRSIIDLRSPQEGALEAHPLASVPGYRNVPLCSGPGGGATPPIQAGGSARSFRPSGFALWGQPAIPARHRAERTRAGFTGSPAGSL